MSRPELVILDEPFSGLDPVNLEVLRDAIVGLKREGSTVVFSTHDMSAAEKMCDQLFMIHNGRKVLDGTLASIQDNYGSDTIRLRIENTDVLSSIHGIERVANFGNYQEIRLTNGTDSQKLLADIVGRTRVSLFEVARPSLHDIFVRIAGSEAKPS